MSVSANMKPVLDFLSNLEKHNEKAWFDQNRDAYERAKEEFEALVNQLIDRQGRVENLAGLTAKDCIMRIFRDVRFSKDKTPYKTNMGTSIAPGGKKSARLGYYLHVALHDGSMVAGGIYDASSAQLASFRQAIDEDSRPFKAIINAPEFKRTFGALGGETVKTAPQGYSKDHPDIELLRMKQVVVVHHLSDDIVLAADFADRVVAAFRAMKPFLDYLNGLKA